MGSIEQFICAFCNANTDEDPNYVRLDLSWRFSEARQSLGAYNACLRAAVLASIPLAIE